MSLYEDLKTAWKSITTQPTIIDVLKDHYVNSTLDDAQIASLFDVKAVSEKHYVRFFASRMFLASSIDWLTQVAPAMYSLTALKFGDHAVELANLAGSKALGSFGKLSQNRSLTINIPLTGLLPFHGGDVIFTCGLASMAGENLLKNFLDTIGEFTAKLAQPQVSLVVSFADTIALGVQNLMGAGKSKLVLQLDRGYTATSGQALKSGFVFMSDAPNGSIPKENLWIIDGEPKIGPTKTAAKPIKGQNYLLTQIQVITERDDYRQFSTISEPLQKAIDARRLGNEKEAATYFSIATLAVGACPDFTSADKTTVTNGITDEFNKTPRPAATTMGLTRGQPLAAKAGRARKVDLNKIVAAARAANAPILATPRRAGRRTAR